MSCRMASDGAEAGDGTVRGDGAAGRSGSATMVEGWRSLMMRVRVLTKGGEVLADEDRRPCSSWHFTQRYPRQGT